MFDKEAVKFGYVNQCRSNADPGLNGMEWPAGWPKHE
jgi:hypothetical protein